MYTIKGVSFNRAARYTVEASTLIEIDPFNLILACPVGADMRGAGLAPILSLTAYFFREEDGSVKTVYSQKDLIRNGQWETSRCDEGALLRLLSGTGKMYHNEMTVEGLKEHKLILQRDNGSLTQQRLIHKEAS